MHPCIQCHGSSSSNYYLSQEFVCVCECASGCLSISLFSSNLTYSWMHQPNMYYAQLCLYVQKVFVIAVIQTFGNYCIGCFILPSTEAFDDHFRSSPRFSSSDFQ